MTRDMYLLGSILLHEYVSVPSSLHHRIKKNSSAHVFLGTGTGSSGPFTMVKSSTSPMGTDGKALGRLTRVKRCTTLTVMAGMLRSSFGQSFVARIRDMMTLMFRTQAHDIENPESDRVIT